MKIEVTQDDIDNGKPGSFASCPIARAVQRDLKEPYARVGTEDVTMTWHGPAKKLSGIARRFIARFDIGKPVRPFSFNLDV